MLSKTEAKDLLIFKLPKVRVESGVSFEDLWIFRAFLPLGGGEENMNPFLSVDKETGSVKDFSVIGCSDPVKLMQLFEIEDGKR